MLVIIKCVQKVSFGT